MTEHDRYKMTPPIGDLLVFLQLLRSLSVYTRVLSVCSHHLQMYSAIPVCFKCCDVRIAALSSEGSGSRFRCPPGHLQKSIWFKQLLECYPGWSPTHHGTDVHHDVRLHIWRRSTPSMWTTSSRRSCCLFVSAFEFGTSRFILQT